MYHEIFRHSQKISDFTTCREFHQIGLISSFSKTFLLLENEKLSNINLQHYDLRKINR